LSVPDHHAALREHFGFAAFRTGQEEAVRAALDGRDVLVVMPTGAGKSLCYQLPALMRDDLTLVVSPLVSLMADQVQSLARRAPGRVALVNAQQEPGANEAAVAAAVRGEVRVLYVAPERFSSPGFARALKAAGVGLFVVDEAHCVSQWGHDFRPDYFRLADAARWLGADAIVASTATATPSVAADIVTRLGLRRPVRVSTGFDRPNLSWVVVPSTPRTKERQLVAALTQPGATPAIVYAGTRRDVDHLAGKLTAALDRPVLAYHAGLRRAERAEAQRRFMEGEVDVVVATNAFGMGVDKADVRTVVHATVPPSVEAYYQEAGRAGRDGAPSRALLLAASKDKGLHVFFIQRAQVTEQDIERIALRLQAAAGGPPGPDDRAARIFDVGVEELSSETPTGATGRAARGRGTSSGDAGATSITGDRVKAVVGALARAGVVQPAPSAVNCVRGRLLTAYDGRARTLCRTIAGDAQRARWRQYRAIWSYVEGERCRRGMVLAHFGDAAAPVPTVGCCDVCDAGLVPHALTSAGSPRHAIAATDLHGAIVALVDEAEPEMGRTRTVDVLRGSRSKEVLRHRYDGLRGYATFAHLPAEQVLAAVDALVAAGRLVSTGGMYPKLRVAAEAQRRLAA
jgi:ATP-dependent DNA helicase RecQ